MLREVMILGIPKKLVKLIGVNLAGSQATVRVDNQYTPTFPITNRVRQGDALSSIIRSSLRSNTSEDEHHRSYRNKKYTFLRMPTM